MSGAAAARPNLRYAIGLARACAGALLFGFPLVMTAEMWSIGFHVAPARLLGFLVLGFGMLLGLAYYRGLRVGGSWADAALEALAAYAAGFVTSGVALVLLGILTMDYGWRGAAGMVALQAVPAGIGAAVARTQLDATDDGNEDADKAGYGGQLFLMAAGAVFLAFNVAPTEEMLLIAYGLGPWQAAALLAVSVGLLHALVYTVGFAGQEQEGGSALAAFLSYTVAGYGLVLLLSLYVLWTFGRTDGVSLELAVAMTVVLAFPAALGAGIARLVV